MRVIYDAEADAAYISLKPIADGEAKRQVTVDADEVTDIVLDLDREGRLTGIEVLGAAARLSAGVLAEAECL